MADFKSAVVIPIAITLHIIHILYLCFTWLIHTIFLIMKGDFPTAKHRILSTFRHLTSDSANPTPTSASRQTHPNPSHTTHLHDPSDPFAHYRRWASGQARKPYGIDYDCIYEKEEMVPWYESQKYKAYQRDRDVEARNERKRRAEEQRAKISDGQAGNWMERAVSKAAERQRREVERNRVVSVGGGGERWTVRERGGWGSEMDMERGERERKRLGLPEVGRRVFS